MRLHSRLSFRLLAALLLLLAAGAASAQATRTWVSGVGDDANPCSRTAPCKTFAGAISKTAAGGIINALDPGGFGGVTITKSITIDGTATEASALVSGTNGIIINAGAADHVVLRGINVFGVGVSLSGIRILAAGSVLIDDVEVQNFSDAGISVATGGDINITVRNASFSNIAGPGILTNPTAGTATLDLEAVSVVQSENGVLAGPRTNVRGKDVNVRDASLSAFEAAPGAGQSANIALHASSATSGTLGIVATGAGARVTLSDTTVTGNATGLSVTGGGAIASFGDNRIVGNAADGQPTEELGNQ